MAFSAQAVQARRKLVELAVGEPESVVMIGDTMETDIRGAIEAGLPALLVLTGSTQLAALSDYVYQPTRVLQSIADLVEEVRTGRTAVPAAGPTVDPGAFRGRPGHRHQTDIFALHKTRPRPAMTK